MHKQNFGIPTQKPNCVRKHTKTPAVLIYLYAVKQDDCGIARCINFTSERRAPRFLGRNWDGKAAPVGNSPAGVVRLSLMRDRSQDWSFWWSLGWSKEKIPLNCDFTFSLGNCMLSHSSFMGHVWGHVWPGKNDMIKLPPVKWHGIVLSHIQSDRSHERQSFSREQPFLREQPFSP
jgi:hypothetical protein